MSGNNGVIRTLAILDLFSEDRLEWTTEEIMAVLGYSRPTLYRYIKSLRDAGLLSSSKGGSITLGPRVVEMDYLMRQSDPLIEHGQQHLDTLAGLFPCHGLLTRFFGNKLLCVASECSISDSFTSYPRGRPMPLSHGAISRSIMSHLPKQQQESMVRKLLPEMQQIGLGNTVESVLSVLSQARKSGVVMARGEVTPGAIGIASAVLLGRREPIASLSVTIAGKHVTPDRLQLIQKEVSARAKALSAQLAESDHRVQPAESQAASTRKQPSKEGKTDEEDRRIHTHMANAVL